VEQEEKKQIKLFISGIALFFIILLVIFFFPIVVIGAGERGVVFNNVSGIEDRILTEGVHFRIPFVESVKSLSIKVQKTDIKAAAASKDLQTVTAQIVVNWHLNPLKVNKIYQNIGDEKQVIERILIPNVNEVVKAATAQKTAEELLTKRPQLKFDIDVKLTERLQEYNVVLDDVSIVDLDFSPLFNQAIEAKATAEQQALKASNDLRRIEIEAQQKIATARAEAESIRIRSAALAENQRLVEWEAIQKWNGILPNYMLGNSVPFINLSK